MPGGSQGIASAQVWTLVLEKGGRVPLDSGLGPSRPHRAGRPLGDAGPMIRTNPGLMRIVKELGPSERRRGARAGVPDVLIRISHPPFGSPAI